MEMEHRPLDDHFALQTGGLPLPTLFPGVQSFVVGMRFAIGSSRIWC